MNNAGMTGALVLIGAGLFVNVFMMNTSTVQAVTAPHAVGVFGDMEPPKRENLQRSLGSQPDCYAVGAQVTWAVFDPQIHPIDLIRGSENLECFYQQTSSADLDGDGFMELRNVDDPGFSYSNGNARYNPFTVLRTTPDGIALEVVLEIETNLQYWKDLTGLEDLVYIYASPAGFFDVNRDGLPDALMLVRASSGAVGDFQEYIGFFWYRNQLAPPDDRMAADVNNDGQVNGADLTIVLSKWTG